MARFPPRMSDGRTGHSSTPHIRPDADSYCNTGSVRLKRSDEITKSLHLCVNIEPDSWDARDGWVSALRAGPALATHTWSMPENYTGVACAFRRSARHCGLVIVIHWKTVAQASPFPHLDANVAPAEALE